MTIGQLIECLIGKVSGIEGHEADGTPFNDIDINVIKDKLEKLGYNRNGTEYLYNGMSGQRMKAMIFIGPTYYQRLKHLVEDKIHCLTMDHEVLTENGWKFFDQITDNDKVATLSNGNVIYEKPKLLYYPKYKGQMFHTASENIDLKVTADHRMYVSVFNDQTGTWSDYGLFNVKSILTCLVKYRDIENNEYIVPDNFGITDEECPVFCLEVPSEVFYVRRNGKAVWTGNSRARGPRTILTRQAPEG